MPNSAGRSSLNVPRVLLATLILTVGPGCSLIFTRGPDPEAKPPPECTTSVAPPVIDTLLAAASVGLVIAGASAAKTTCVPSAFNPCGVSDAGWVAVIGGAASGLLFAGSAVIGYKRTSDCRAFREKNGLSPPTPDEPPKSLLKHGSAEACAVGDAPRACSRGAQVGLVSAPVGALR